MNLSASILIWTLGGQPAEFYSKLADTYIGNFDWEGDNNWGEYYYVKTEKDYSTGLMENLRVHPMYVRDYYTEEGNQIIIFKFTPEQREKIIKPFLEGKYSEIDREYVNKYFRRNAPSGKISTNWQILNKAPALRKHWERELNVTPYIRISIPEEAEVWSKVKKEHEILNYKEDKSHKKRSSKVG